MATRTFLISGASKGIGLALATRLANSGHRVVGIARNAIDGKFPGELVLLDLADDRSSREIIAALVNRYKFDGVINDVRLVNPAPISKVTLDFMDEVNRVNLPLGGVARASGPAKHAGNPVGKNRECLKLDGTRRSRAYRLCRCQGCPD